MVSPINWVRLRPYSISTLECELQVWFSLHGGSAGSMSLAEARRLQFLYSQHSAAAAEGGQPDSRLRLRTKFNQTPVFSSASQGEAASFVTNALKEMVLQFCTAEGHSTAEKRCREELRNGCFCGEKYPFLKGFESRVYGSVLQTVQGLQKPLKHNHRDQPF